NRPSRQLVFALPVLGHHRGKFSLLWHAQTLIAEPNAVEGKISTTAKPRWAKRKVERDVPLRAGDDWLRQRTAGDQPSPPFAWPS
ncbi:MAG: hypothetical protein ABGY13_05105, partial [Verrucomicrobiia bacterium]